MKMENRGRLPVHLWRTGLLRITPAALGRVVTAWFRCPGTLAFLAESAAARRPAGVALCDDDGSMTFADLRASYETLARRLIGEFQLGPGRLVVLIGRNHRSFVIGLLAASRSGADVLLANPASPPQLLDELLASHPVDLVLHGEDQAFGPGALCLRRFEVAPSSYEAKTGPRRLPRLRAPGRLAVLTSGTTSRAKRINRRPGLAEVLPTVTGLLEALPVRVGAPIILSVPLFHGHGLATLAMALGFACPIHTGRKYEIGPLLEKCPSDTKPTVVSVPTLLQRWLDREPREGSVAAIVSGSAPLHPSLAQRLLRGLGPVLFNLYGSSEAGIVSLATPAALQMAPGSVGRPLPGNEVRVVDSEGRPAGAGKTGRLLVSGPLVLGAGADGFADTGDIGFFDEAGHLFVTGRSDAMIVSGGENVYPQEIEACLLGHPSIGEAAVVAVPDREFGQRVRAFVVPNHGCEVAVPEVRTWLSGRLDRYKMPRSIDVLAALPRGPLGKIDRQALGQLPEERVNF